MLFIIFRTVFVAVTVYSLLLISIVLYGISSGLERCGQQGEQCLGWLAGSVALERNSELPKFMGKIDLFARDFHDFLSRILGAIDGLVFGLFSWGIESAVSILKWIFGLASSLLGKAVMVLSNLAEWSRLMPVVDSLTGMVSLFLRNLTASTNELIATAGLILIVGAGISLIYSITTYFVGISEKRRYWSRVWFQQAGHYLLLSAIWLAGLGMVPIVHSILKKLKLDLYFHSVTLDPEPLAVVAVIVGAVLAFLQYRRTREDGVSSGLNGSRALMAAGLLLFGFLILVYAAALNIYGYATYIYEYDDLDDVNTLTQWMTALFSIGLILGVIVNLNQASFHRMYRDRLMETFLPDPDSTKNLYWRKAHEANETSFHNICGWAKILSDEKSTGERGWFSKTKDAINKRWRKEEQSGASGGMLDNEKKAWCGPYPIINTNVVLVDSENQKYRGRGGDNFILSPLYCGSEATGWCRTDRFMGGDMGLATAMAISGAALNPNAGVGGHGVTRNLATSLLLTLLNLRLGYWVRSPDAFGNFVKGLAWRPNYLHPTVTTWVTSQFHEKAMFLELSDGGHFDNTGIYELVRRQAKLIVVSDAGADPDMTFSDLAVAIERVRADFGTQIEFLNVDYGLCHLFPPGDNGACRGEEETGSSSPKVEKKNIFQDKNFAERGFAVGCIKYEDGSRGILCYLKPTIVEGLPADVYAYRAKNQDFPHQTTADQFFDEEQFEAYRVLGKHIAQAMVDKVLKGDEDMAEKFCTKKKDEQKNKSASPKHGEFEL